MPRQQPRPAQRSL